jgi:glutamate-1-semialdehyde 2,1-aminomutase/spore coat polysaccharide biosynthesis protein SpsF
MTQPSFVESERLYARACETVPLATQTFSKSAFSLVKGASPLFLERGDGCRVWDVDGNEYVDHVLGLLPIVLGYRDPDVDGAIRAQLERGIVFSLATELEAELAERLRELIPCAEMTRFGKNGSDATSAAIRLARAHTGRDRVACAGYHGWHDWYIGATARSLGVPRAVRELTSTFPFNDADALARLLQAHPDGYAAVMLEPAALAEPAPGFLEGVRELCHRHGVVLIFDEIVTGFRIDLGGAQKRYGVIPDLACFGKAMGNGMPISAVLGRAAIMRRMEDIFFSGTFGGEALSLAASLATLAKLERQDAVAHMRAHGAALKAGVGRILRERGLSERVEVVGGDWWPGLKLTAGPELDDALLTSLLRQELHGAGVLQLATFNICLAHAAPDVLDDTLRRWDRAAEALADHLRANNPRGRLRGEPVRPVFQVRR